MKACKLGIYICRIHAIVQLIAAACHAMWNKKGLRGFPSTLSQVKHICTSTTTTPFYINKVVSRLLAPICCSPLLASHQTHPFLIFFRGSLASCVVRIKQTKQGKKHTDIGYPQALSLVLISISICGEGRTVSGGLENSKRKKKKQK